MTTDPVAPRRGDQLAASPAPRRGGFFYGWVIVAVMAATAALNMALGTLNFGLFVRPMGDELGIGRSIFGWAQSARQVGSAVTAPLVGALIDRFGSRTLLAVAALVTGGALCTLGFITEGWQLVALYALIGSVSMNGPGALVTTVPVTKWFVQQRGRALAYASLGIPLGGLIFVPLTQVLIEAFGWRTAWVLLAVVGAGVIVPLALIFLRRQPEDLGLLPDGVVQGAVAVTTAGQHQRRASAPGRTEERSWTRAEALRTTTFWRLVFVFSMVMLATNSVGVHRTPISPIGGSTRG